MFSGPRLFQTGKVFDGQTCPTLTFLSKFHVVRTKEEINLPALSAFSSEARISDGVVACGMVLFAVNAEVYKGIFLPVLHIFHLQRICVIIKQKTHQRRQSRWKPISAKHFTKFRHKTLLQCCRKGHLSQTTVSYIQLPSREGTTRNLLVESNSDSGKNCCWHCLSL